MKRYIRSSTAKYSFEPGANVTVYEGKFGYANWEGTFVDSFINRYGVEMAKVRREYGEEENIPMSSIIPSQKKYLYSLDFDDVVTKEFVSSMVFKDDSIWCHRISVPRVDKNPSMENVVGYDALIVHYDSGYRVNITTYISKNYSTTKESEDESRLSIDDPMIDEALEILRSADKVIVDFAGYQRVFTK